MTKYVIDWFAAATWALGRIELLIKGLLFGLLLLTAGLAFESRDPPIIDIPHDPIRVRAGEWAEIRIPVQRNLQRACSFKYSRILLDVDGTPFEMLGRGGAYEEVLERAKLSPNELVIMLLLPPPRTPNSVGVDYGPAKLITRRNFVCNPLHVYFPIEQTVVNELLIQP